MTELNPVPTVSVGICAVSEEKTTLGLAEQILSLEQSDCQLKEVIVATPNDRLAARLTGMNPRLTVVLERKRNGKPAALNEILKRATGDVLVLASADIIIERSSIPLLVRGLRDDVRVGAVDSNVQILNKDSTLMDQVGTILWKIHNNTLDTLAREDRLGHIAGDLIAVRRNLIGQIPSVVNDDAYIALGVRRKGFTVDRVENSLVWILAPSSPSDYFLQRSRILRGHLQLIADFGALPTTFEFNLLRHPGKALALLAKTVAELGPKYLPVLILSAILELVSFQHAVLTLLSRRPLRPWKFVESTKKLRTSGSRENG